MFALNARQVDAMRKRCCSGLFAMTAMAMFGLAPLRADVVTVPSPISSQHPDALLFQGELEATLVTASGAGSPGTHVLAAGSAVPGYSGFSHQGVGRITNAMGGLTCSASLLDTGRHVLTAAHCFDGASATASWTVHFDLPARVESVAFTQSNVTQHPNYSTALGPGAGYDVAIVTLSGPVAADVPRYGVVGSGTADTFDAAHLRIGYGESGDGDPGLSLPRGTKRWGENRWEANGLSGVVTNEATHLTYDFDSGAEAQDGFGFFFGTTGPFAGGDPSFNDPVGEGEDEVAGGPGDSGGAVFVEDTNGDMRVAGVASYVARVVATGTTLTSDLDASVSSSFGEFGGDVRLAHPEIASFVQNVTAVPEPSAAMALCIALLGHMLGRRLYPMLRRFNATP